MPNKACDGNDHDPFSVADLNFAFNFSNYTMPCTSTTSDTMTEIEFPSIFADENPYSILECHEGNLSFDSNETSGNFIFAIGDIFESFHKNVQHKPKPYEHLNQYRLLHPRNIIIGHLNVNSLRSKFVEVKHILECGYIDLLCISETKLDSSDNDMIFNVKGFSFIRKDKRKNSGGLLIFISHNIVYREIHLNNVVYDRGIENLCIELTFDKDDTWLLCYLYKNPMVRDTDFDAFFSSLSDSITSSYDSFMCIGDLNLNVLDESCLLNNLCSVYGYENLINECTCYKSITSPSLIDVFLINEQDKARFFKSFSVDTGISDFHNLIGVAMRKYIMPKKDNYIEYRDIKSINYDRVREDLLLQNIDLEVRHLNANDAFDKFHGILCALFNKHAPLKRKKILTNAFPIMDIRLSRAILYRNRRRNVYYSTRCPINYIQYKCARNNVTRIKRLLAAEYLQERCSGGTSNSSFWPTIKPFCSKKMKARSEINLIYDNKLLTDKQTLCDTFCAFFTEIGSDISSEDMSGKTTKEIIDQYKGHSSIKRIRDNCVSRVPFILQEVNILDIKRAIRKLKSRKSPGYDDIPDTFYKALINDISGIILYLTNLCIRQNVFPQCLKKSNISPVFKKKDRLCIDNYRSINLLPILSKIFEDVFLHQINQHVDSFFHRGLSGFRRKHGCEDVLTHFVEKCRETLDKNKLAGTVAIDLTKAFDCMSHGLLIAKLYAYGYDVNTCEFIRSYIMGREQRVKIERVMSEWKHPLRGVPQGSLAGPVLFNIFINDLLYLDMHSLVYNYADDNTLLCMDNDINMIKLNLTSDCSKLIEWFSENNMRANPAKFQFMIIGKHTNSMEHSLTVSGAQLNGSRYINVLGVDIDERLNFTEHINSMCKKVATQINAISRIKTNLCTKGKQTLYNSFIVGSFAYCCNIWMFTNRSNISRLDRLNKRAIKQIYGKHCDYNDILRLNNHLDIYQICIKSLGMKMYNIRNEVSPKYVQELVISKDNVYNMRDYSTYVLPKYNTKRYGYHCLRYMGSKLWNWLDVGLKSCNDLCAFKRDIKLLLIRCEHNQLVDMFF